MQTLIDTLLIALSLAVLVPIAMFCLEVLVSLWPTRRQSVAALPAGARVAVLIPAHNEEAVIGKTLETLLPTLPAGAMALVVADNCSDHTAEIARGVGAQVVERSHASERGKGYALDFGVKALEAFRPSVVVFLDADCQVDPALVRTLAAAALQTGRPVQGLNLCDPDPQGGTLQAVSGLAFRFKNLVRTLGLSRIAGLNYLTGTGMALPWNLLEKVSLAGGNVVEDMQLGIDLALDGHRPVFVPEGAVRSPLPQQRRAARTQRTRWEHGHLKTLISQVPRLLSLALKRRRIDLMLLALDLAIPPLSLLVAITACSAVVATLLALSGLATWVAATMLGVGLAALLIAVIAGWAVHCREAIPLSALWAAPVYALAKLPIYLQFIVRREREWVRTDRDPAKPVAR